MTSVFASFRKRAQPAHTLASHHTIETTHDLVLHITLLLTIMNTLTTSIYYSIALSSAFVQGKYVCNLDSVPNTCHQQTQAIGLSSVRPERQLLLTFDLSTVTSKLGIIGQGRYGLLAPDFEYLQANHMMFLHAIMIASILSVIIYHSK